MNLEPQVLASIGRNKRDIRILKARVMLLPSLVTAGCIGFFFYSFRQGWMSGAEGPGLSKLIRLLPFVALLFIGALFLIYGWYRFLIRAPRSFDYFTREARDYDRQGFRKYDGSLEAVSIAVGVPKPRLVVLALPTANAVSFTKGSESCVGITAELLKKNLGLERAESLMAHQLSQIIEGHIAEPPGLCHVRNLVTLVLYPLCAISIFLALIAIPSDSSSEFVIINICAFFLFIALLVFLGKQYERFRMLDFAGDILADSIACQITKNPRAMIRTIEEMDSLMESAEEVPEDTTYYKYLFTFPREPESGWAALAKQQNLLVTPDTGTRILRRESGLSEAATRVRIRNLEAIETGYWRYYDWKQWKKLVRLYAKQGS